MLIRGLKTSRDGFGVAFTLHTVGAERAEFRCVKMLKLH